MFEDENRKKIIIAAAVLLGVVILVFYILPLFFKKDNFAEILPSEIVLNEEELNLKMGEGYLLIPDLYPSNTDVRNIKWMSSDSSVVSVDENGMLQAIRPGVSIITATTENKLTDFTIVEVTIGNEEISSLSLNMENISLKVGTKKKFEIILDPIDTKYESVEWETNNKKVVTIDQNGEVTGIAVGTAVITAKVKIDALTTLSVSSNINVVKETTLFANNSNSLKQLYPYKEIEMSIRISDNAIQLNNLEVYSLNNNVVTVISGPNLENNEIIKFKVRGISIGNTDIIVKASTKDGENLQLNLPTQVNKFTSITLEKNSVSLYEEEQTIVNVKVSPSIGVTMYPNCVVTDPSIAQVFAASPNNDSYNGACVIRGLKKGKTTVNVTLSGFTKTITVYVNSNKIETSKVTLNRTSGTIPMGQTMTLTATVSPANATDKTVTWLSSDPSIATISNGIITTHKAGKVTITAKNSGGQTANATITVTDNSTNITDKTIIVESVSIDPSSALLNEGQSVTLRTTFYPNNATDKTVTWISSDSNIATVNNGVVTAKNISESQATVTITAITGNNKTATATIYVVKNNSQIEPTGISLNKSNITLKVGETQVITATVSPSNATNKTVTWASNNNDIATVSNGVITAVHAGETSIIAQNSNGQTATIVVNVENVTTNNSGGGTSNGGTSSSGNSGGSTTKNPPKITITKTSGTEGENGWYTTDVKLKVTVEAEAGLSSFQYCLSMDGASCTPNVNLTNGTTLLLQNQGMSLQIKTTAVDKNGNSTSKNSLIYKIDKTKPTCKITASSVSTGVILNAIGTDTHSGMNGIRDWSSSTYITYTNTRSKNVSTEGTYSFYVRDKAGNTNSCSRSLYKCARVRSCKTCISGNCTKGCSVWNSWTDWYPWNDRMYPVQTEQAYNQIETDFFMNSDCSNG